MIIDSHCHARRYWPYAPPIPDPSRRGSVEQFLFEDGLRFIGKAVEHNQIASLAIPLRLPPILRHVAECCQTVPFLCHHLAGARAAEPPPYLLCKEILASARVPNLSVNMSGFGYASTVGYEYPYSERACFVRDLYERFGHDRLRWSSNYPPVRWYLTYQQALEAFRSHCTFLPDDHKQRLLRGAGPDLIGAGRRQFP